MSIWIKKWSVPKSDGSGVYVVSVDAVGNYGCSCPHWKFRRMECKHIQEIRSNGGSDLKEAPKIAPVKKEKTVETVSQSAVPALNLQEVDSLLSDISGRWL